MSGKEMGGSISLIWLQTARVDQKAPKVLLFYQRSKNWNRIRLFLVFWLAAASFKKNISKVSAQYCTNIATSVFFICLIFTVNYFTFFICLWCSMIDNCKVFRLMDGVEQGYNRIYYCVFPCKSIICDMCFRLFISSNKMLQKEIVQQWTQSGPSCRVRHRRVLG